METVKKEAFKVIGIKVRTTNENGQAAKDIGELWGRFMSENVIENIPNKIDRSILSIYTNYESDHTKPYDTILGCRVSTLETIPEGMIGQEFGNSNYRKFTSSGNLAEGVVYRSWLKIWDENLDRIYTADFEVYGEKAQDRENAQVDIFVGVK